MQRQRNSRVIISEFLSSVIPKGDTERPNEGTGQAKGIIVIVIVFVSFFRDGGTLGNVGRFYVGGRSLQI